MKPRVAKVNEYMLNAFGYRILTIGFIGFLGLMTWIAVTI